MEPIQDDRPVLIGQAGPLNGSQWVIEGEMLIGRDPSCPISIPDRQISRLHARVTQRAEGIFIEDLSSKNGTYVNGSLISEGSYLKNGDAIQIAFAQEFVFISADATMPLAGGPTQVPARKKRLALENNTRQVWVMGRELDPPLSAAQFRLLEILCASEGQVVSRQALTDHIWGASEALGVSNQALDALIRRLRDRLAEIDPEYEYVITVRGHGLKLDNSGG
jgi:hypothetical protein